MKIIKVEDLKMKNLLIELIMNNDFYNDDVKQEIKNHLTWKDIIEKLVESEGRLYIVFFSGFKIELPLIKGNRSYNLFIDYSNHLSHEAPEKYTKIKRVEFDYDD